MTSFTLGSELKDTYLTYLHHGSGQYLKS